MRLLEIGYRAQAVIDELVGADAPFAEYRQLGVIDADGHAAARTGKENEEWAGHRIGNGYIALGNHLAGERVVEAMERAFTADLEADLEERLLRGIEAGREAGGERAPQRSAALLAYSDKPFAHVDLRVDVHDDPVGELRRAFDAFRPAIPYYNLRQVDPPGARRWLEEHPGVRAHG